MYVVRKTTKRFRSLLLAAMVLMLGFMPACRPKAKYGGPPDSYKKVPAMEDSARKG